jgi:hypothetical protein
MGLTSRFWTRNVMKSEEVTAGRTEASEEGQGPHRTVEPATMMMMMMTIMKINPSNFKIFKKDINNLKSYI